MQDGGLQVFWPFHLAAAPVAIKSISPDCLLPDNARIERSHFFGGAFEPTVRQSSGRF
jgi:hypothetical protein